MCCLGPADTSCFDLRGMVSVSHRRISMQFSRFSIENELFCVIICLHGEFGSRTIHLSTGSGRNTTANEFDMEDVE
jgi:hypothetical protein